MFTMAVFLYYIHVSQMAAWDYYKPLKAPLGGRVESQIMLQRQTHTCIQLGQNVCACSFFWFVCVCVQVCVLRVAFDDKDGLLHCVCVFLCAFYLCHTLFDYAEPGTVCSSQTGLR